MADIVDKIIADVANAVYKGSVLVATEAKENQAPKGATLQLRSGIRALNPHINSNGEIIGIVISQAKSRNGFNYALKQHDQELRHVSSQPLLGWFGDGQPGKTQGEKYRVGYYRLRDTSPKFATEYLTKSYEIKRDIIVRMAEKALRDA